jgi:hypothetical protein
VTVVRDVGEARDLAPHGRIEQRGVGVDHGREPRSGRAYPPGGRRFGNRSVLTEGVAIAGVS